MKTTESLVCDYLARLATNGERVTFQHIQAGTGLESSDLAEALCSEFVEAYRPTRPDAGHIFNHGAAPWQQEPTTCYRLSRAGLTFYTRLYITNVQFVTPARAIEPAEPPRFLPRSPQIPRR